METNAAGEFRTGQMPGGYDCADLGEMRGDGTEQRRHRREDGRLQADGFELEEEPEKASERGGPSEDLQDSEHSAGRSADSHPLLGGKKYVEREKLLAVRTKRHGGSAGQAPYFRRCKQEEI